MLETESFLKKLADEDYSHLCVVPCSFAKNIINACINSDMIEYVPCASEAVVCSVAAGLSMSGKKPIVIVQSSGLTNMGSCITSLLKPYTIRFPIIVSWRKYKEGDSEIQHAHLATKLPDLVQAYGYEYELLAHDDEETAIKQIDQCIVQDKILLLQKETFSNVELNNEHKLDLSNYPVRSQYLNELNELYSGSDTIFIGTTGNTAREMYTIMPDTKNFYMAGNMGGALSLGIGASMAGKNIIVCGGDAEFVMHMGALTTAGRYHSKEYSLTYIIFDNESNKSTGGQKTYQSHVNYLVIARASGWKVVEEKIESIKHFQQIVSAITRDPGMKVIHVKASYDDELPRPPASTIISSTLIFK